MSPSPSPQRSVTPGSTTPGRESASPLVSGLPESWEDEVDDDGEEGNDMEYEPTTDGSEDIEFFDPEDDDDLAEAFLGELAVTIL